MMLFGKNISQDYGERGLSTVPRVRVESERAAPWASWPARDPGGCAAGGSPRSAHGALSPSHGLEAVHRAALGRCPAWTAGSNCAELHSPGAGKVCIIFTTLSLHVCSADGSLRTWRNSSDCGCVALSKCIEAEKADSFYSVSDLCPKHAPQFRRRHPFVPGNSSLLCGLSGQGFWALQRPSCAFLPGQPPPFLRTQPPAGAWFILLKWLALTREKDVACVWG